MRRTSQYLDDSDKIMFVSSLLFGQKFRYCHINIENGVKNPFHFQFNRYELVTGKKKFHFMNLILDGSI